LRHHSRAIITRRQLTDPLCSLHCPNGAITLAEPQHFGLTMVPLEEENTIRLVPMKAAVTFILKNQLCMHQVYSLHDVNSPVRCSITHVQFAGNLCGYHKAFDRSFEQEVNAFTIIHSHSLKFLLKYTKLCKHKF